MASWLLLIAVAGVTPSSGTSQVCSKKAIDCSSLADQNVCGANNNNTVVIHDGVQPVARRLQVQTAKKPDDDDVLKQCRLTPYQYICEDVCSAKNKARWKARAAAGISPNNSEAECVAFQTPDKVTVINCSMASRCEGQKAMCSLVQETCRTLEYQCDKCAPAHQASCCDQCQQAKQNDDLAHVECHEQTSCSPEALQQNTVEHKDLKVPDRSYVLFVSPSSVFESLVEEKPSDNASSEARGFAKQNTPALIAVSIMALLIAFLIYVLLKLIYDWLSVRIDFVTAKWREESKPSGFLVACLNGLMLFFALFIEGLLGLLTSIYTSLECSSDKDCPDSGMYRARYIEVARRMAVLTVFGFIGLVVLVPPLTLAWGCAYDLVRRGGLKSCLNYVILIIFVFFGAVLVLYPLAAVVTYIETIARSSYRFFDEWTVAVTSGIGTSCWSASDDRLRAAQVMIYIVAVLTWLGYLTVFLGFIGKHTVAYFERKNLSS